MYDNLENWRHITKHIASNLGLCLNTVNSKIRSLVGKGLLDRTPKNNGEFGYIYSIPEKYKKFDAKISVKIEKGQSKNFCSKRSKNTTAKLPTANFTATKFGVDNNNEQINTELNKNLINQSREKDERNILYLEEKTEIINRTDILEMETTDYEIVVENNESLSEGINTPVGVCSRKEQETTNRNGVENVEAILADEEFMAFVQAELPNMQNPKAYLRSKDKETGEPIWIKYWAKFKGSDSTAKVEKYWKERLPYEQMQWEKDLPTYSQWLNRVKNCKREDSFTEDTSLGQHRNTRIMFYRWYENYYLPTLEKELESNGELPPVNPIAMEVVGQFEKAWGK
ncbi:hypothetical protein [Geminocystis sp. NIES-3709]|uniref:hypothetical protein n=1 Tax=Geminocystis sp. NIES-3709 TaxID=1617448 RepID=UPI0011875B39|nr:hypothetical protein [Geminocystis sp. NIES-3709]